MERVSFRDQISRNKWKSVFLIIGIFFVFLILGYVIGIALGPDYFTIIMILATIISLIYLVIGYYYSANIALASVKAKPASSGDYPQFHQVVEGLCLASGLPKPKLYVMNNNDINAFASGRNPQNAVVCVTTGALEKLNKQELEGVLAHELGHVANYDIRFMTLVAVLVGMISIISQIFLRSLFFAHLDSEDKKGNALFIIIGIVLAILAPIVVSLVQLAISRKREYTADASCVKFVRSPTGLISALKKIDKEKQTEEDKAIPKAVATMFISDPFKKRFEDMFSTHPSIRKRIEILERM